MTDLIDRFALPQAPQNPLDQYWAGEDANAASAVLLRRQNPERAAEANRIARTLGLAPDTVERNFDAFQTQAEVRRARQLFGKYPLVASWASDPRNASIASDDLDALEKNARYWQGAVTGSIRATPETRPTLGNVLSGLGIAFVEGGRQVRSGFRSIAADLFPNVSPRTAPNVPRLGDVGLQNSLRDFERSNARVDDTTPAFKSWWARDLYSGTSSLVQMAPAIAASVATGNVAPVLTIAGAQQGLPAYSKYRARGATPGQASLGAGLEGGAEAAGEALPMGFLVSRLGKIGLKPFLAGFFGRELPSELATTIAQNATDTAIANPDKTWGEFLAELPADLRTTAVGTLVMSAAAGGLNDAARRLNRKQEEQLSAANNAQAIDQGMAAAAESKVRGRDSEAFSRLMGLQVDGSPVGSMFVPAEKLATYFQSNDIDYHNDDFWSGYSEQIDQGLVTGGDVVIPTSQAAAHLAGTPAWEAVKSDVRTSAGGMSLSEAEAFENAKVDELEKMGSDMAAELEQIRAEMLPRQKIAETVRDELMKAGYTPDAASINAELVASRYATRAARLGRELTGDEAKQLTIRQILPEGLAPAVAADQLDLVIAAMKGGKEAKPKRGASLLEFIARGGGIEDKGGDIAAMGGAEWHKGKPGRRKLIRESLTAQSAMFGTRNERTPDALAMAAWEAGYFPDLTERPDVNTLLDAIGEELRGNPRFAETDESATLDVRKAAEDLRALLEQRGIDPDKADAKAIRDEVRKYQAEAERGALQQTYGDGPRGQISFANGHAVIELFESRDLSTFVHEIGHSWLEQLREDATSPDAPEQLKADWQAVQDWFKANGHPLKAGAIPVDAHELWARGVERFVMEGKSPSTGLRKVFDTFRAWLLQIYKLADNLRAPITPEIREVMERLIATDEEIAQARQRQFLTALFADAEEAGMTDAEFAAYQTAASGAKNEAFDQLLAKTMQTIRQARTKAWKEEESGVKADITARVNRRPEFKALHLLRTGKFLDNPDAEPIRAKLDTAWLVHTYGEDVLGLLPKGVPPIYSHERSTDADTLAEMVGFRTGDEMVRTLIGLEQRQVELRNEGDKRSVKARLIDEETAAEMRDRHGDPLNDGSIEEEALAAVMNDKQGELIASELRVLQRKRGSSRPATPYALAKEWAARTVREGKVNDVASRSAIQRYARAAAKAAKEAEAAILKGDVDETFKQKQRQMLNAALVSEAKKAADDIDAAVSRLGKIAKRPTIKSVEQSYLDQAHALLEQVEFRDRSQASIDRQESFSAWARQREAEGHDVVVPDTFAESLGTTHWSRLTVENLLGLDETVKQIVHLGRLKQKLIDAKEEREFNEVLDEAAATAERLPPKPPKGLADPSWTERFKSNVANADAALLKMETVFDWLDGDAKGVFNRVVFRPIAEAQTREQDMFKDYASRLDEALAGLGKDTLRSFQGRVRIPELIDSQTGEAAVLNRKQLISMALNMGNEGNAQRLADGHGWDEAAIQSILVRELSAEEWGYVQKVWDIIDGLWPEIEAMEKRLNGVAPERVAPRPIETAAGTLRGGYFPVVYDTARDYRSEQQSGESSDLFESKYTRATTTASATKERLEKVKRPILLDLGVITRHVGEVIHDITHREAVMNADKFLSHPRVMKAVDQTLGREIRQQFRPWLKFVANQWAIERSGNEGTGAFIGKLRSNATVVGLGFRVTTVMMQLAGYSNSFEVVGARWVGPAMAQAFNPRTMTKTWNFVLERSGEVRHRMDTIERDINEGIKRLAGKANPLSEAKRFAYHGIGYTDRLVVIPTWLGAYNKALSEGATEEDAIYAGDKAVRQSQGAGAAKDMAAVQRGTGKWGEALKLFTMFYSYMSAVYQRQRTLGRDVRSAKSRDLPGLMARAFWLVVVPPILSELMAGRGPDDDEDWGWWAFSRMLFQFVGAIPMVRDLAPVVYNKLAKKQTFGYALSPLQNVGSSAERVAGDLRKLWDGDGTKRATRNALEATGYWTGLVPGQVAAAAQFLVDVGYGEQRPQDVGDWWEGLTTGKIKDD